MHNTRFLATDFFLPSAEYIRNMYILYIEKKKHDKNRDNKKHKKKWNPDL